jgi:uncharacterized protein (DUF849 family)
MQQRQHIELVTGINYPVTSQTSTRLESNARRVNINMVYSVFKVETDRYFGTAACEFGYHVRVSSVLKKKGQCTG